jgi:4-amino-4-deoxy-L-arabinose transferase-like glycosyltransferase
MKTILIFFNKVYNNKKLLFSFIFLASIFFSLIFLSFFKNIGPSEHGLPGTDYLTIYEPMAENILQGKGFTVEGRVRPEISSGFPIYLAGIFSLAQFLGIEKINVIIFFNVILTAFSSCLLFLIAKAVFNKRIALISSFLWMTYPFNLWFLKQPHTEVPFIFLLYTGILFYILTLERKKTEYAFFAGATLSLTYLIRPIAIFLPFFLAGLLIIIFFLKAGSKKRAIFLAAVLLLGSLLVVFPWILYSIFQTGNFIVFSDQASLGISVGIYWLLGTTENFSLPSDLYQLIERVEAENLDSINKVFTFFSRETKDNPLLVMRLIGLKLIRSWYATSSAWHEKETLTIQLIYLFPSIFGLIYLIKTNKEKILSIIPFLVIIFYFWAMTFFALSIMRYMVPAMGLVMIFLAVFINFLIEKLVKKRFILL